MEREGKKNEDEEHLLKNEIDTTKKQSSFNIFPKKGRLSSDSKGNQERRTKNKIDTILYKY